jgi:hypothetical protein
MIALRKLCVKEISKLLATSSQSALCALQNEATDSLSTLCVRSPQLTANIPSYAMHMMTTLVCAAALARNAIKICYYRAERPPPKKGKLINALMQQDMFRVRIKNGYFSESALRTA